MDDPEELKVVNSGAKTGRHRKHPCFPGLPWPLAQ